MSIAFLFFFVGISLMLLAGAVIYYATYAVRSQWFGTTDWHGREDTGAVALTFDDGPTADTAHSRHTRGAQRLRDVFHDRPACRGSTTDCASCRRGRARDREPFLFASDL